MCYEFEREYWLRRADEIRREMRKNEERLKQPANPAPQARPARDAEQADPVPA